VYYLSVHKRDWDPRPDANEKTIPESLSPKQQTERLGKEKYYLQGWRHSLRHPQQNPTSSVSAASGGNNGCWNDLLNDLPLRT
jgi:hypothetical protein